MSLSLEGFTVVTGKVGGGIIRLMGRKRCASQDNVISTNVQNNGLFPSTWSISEDMYRNLFEF